MDDNHVSLVAGYPPRQQEFSREGHPHLAYLARLFQRKSQVSGYILGGKKETKHKKGHGYCIQVRE